MSDHESAVVHIGRCIGCDAMGRLDDGVCEPCLAHPKRGRRWAELSYRVRTDPEIARLVYERIPSVRGRELFRRMYGGPHER